jgi:cytidylate kinase
MVNVKIPDRIIIAIDGHSSGGKSTFAKAIAKELGITYIDSGAMYRAVTLFCLEKGLIKGGNIDVHELENSLNDIKIDFRFNDAQMKSDTFLNGKNVEEKIRDIEVSKHVSPVSKIGSVREKMVTLQREMAKNRSVVMDGRDIGSVVFPDAEIKIFLTASEEIRAKRRYDELKQKGMEITFREVEENIADRDHQDSSREISPLIQPVDAQVLDNSYMSVENQMDWFRGLLIDKFGILLTDENNC